MAVSSRKHPSCCKSEAAGTLPALTAEARAPAGRGSPSPLCWRQMLQEQLKCVQAAADCSARSPPSANLRAASHRSLAKLS